MYVYSREVSAAGFSVITVQQRPKSWVKFNVEVPTSNSVRISKYLPHPFHISLQKIFSAHSTVLYRFPCDIFAPTWQRRICEEQSSMHSRLQQCLSLFTHLYHVFQAKRSSLRTIPVSVLSLAVKSLRQIELCPLTDGFLQRKPVPFHKAFQINFSDGTHESRHYE